MDPLSRYKEQGFPGEPEAMRVSQRQVAGSSGRPSAVGRVPPPSRSTVETVQAPRSEQVDSADLQGIQELVGRVLSADQTARSEHVQHLTMLVDAGAYEVDAASLSRAIVDDLLEK
jgi:hypothetical protein